jgi:type IV pilus assembly protein PilB
MAPRAPDELAGDDSRPMADRIGELLVRENLISLAQLKRAQADQRTTGKRLSYSLSRLGILGERELADFLSAQYGVPWMSLTDYEIDPKVVELVPRAVASKHTALPVQRAGSTLVVAMADPSNIYAIDDLKFVTNLNVEPVVSTETAIEEAIARYYDRATPPPPSEPRAPERSAERPSSPSAPSLPESDQAIRLCNRVLVHAASRGATQVHIEPSERGLRIRLRIDGVLQPEPELPLGLRGAVITRFKLMAGLDVAERRTPQEGQIRGFRAGTDREIDLRVATMPTAAGEKLVLRLLDRSSVSHDLGGLGLEPEQLRQVRAALARPQGLTIVAGPTGSGTTTTLYAALGELAGDHVSIATVEDPVEHALPGCTQVQVQKDSGLGVAAAVQALLRQDPDIVMIGGLPDLEAVDAAVRAAISGRRVLTTLPTGDAASTLIRLVHLGIEPYLVAAAVSLVIAQRLVRRLCGECSSEDAGATAARLIEAGMTQQQAQACRPRRARGCKACLGGYRGRVALFEVLPIGAALQERIAEGAGAAELRAEAVRLGFRSLRAVGLTQVAAGTIGLDDLLRATGERLV